MKVTKVKVNITDEDGVLLDRVEIVDHSSVKARSIAQRVIDLVEDNFWIDETAFKAFLEEDDD